MEDSRHAVFSRRFGNCSRRGLPADFTQKGPRLGFSAVVIRAGGAARRPPEDKLLAARGISPLTCLRLLIRKSAQRRLWDQ